MKVPFPSLPLSGPWGMLTLISAIEYRKYGWDIMGHVRHP